MLNPIKVIKKILSPKPLMSEAAPASENAAIGAYLDPFTKIISNQDTVLMTKGGGDLKIYHEVLRDDQVKSTFQQRRLAVVSKPWEVEAGAEDAQSKAMAEALKTNLKAINFDNITDKQSYALFYGYGVGEIMWAIADGLIHFGSIRIRDRARFRFNIDGKLFLQKADYQYQQMPERKFWTLNTGADHDDNPYGVGLAHWLYWPVFFKRNDIKFWLIFLEKFGQPTGVGKLPAGKENDTATRNKVLQALRSIATETGVLIPEGAEITLLEATRSGAADYEGMKDAMDAAISKIVLSQTMTTDNGSSHSQSNTHADVRDMVVAADADLLCESFNDGPVQWWYEYNLAAFPNAARPRVYRNVTPQKDTKLQADEDKIVCEMGYEPTEERIRELYGEGWVKKQQQQTQIGNPPNNIDPNQANFAESALIDAIKLGQRGDQIALLNVANQFAENYQGVIGQRVQQLLDYAESSSDFETFQKRLNELVADLPSPQTVEKTARANFSSRLMGLFRGQR